MHLKWDEDGLIPAIVQDVETGQVLMLAWMDAEALRLTRESGEANFWSRSRQEPWRKGATSGNVQHVQEIRYDCDADVLLLRVHPAGPACHTGEVSCFYREMTANHQLSAADRRGQSFSLNDLFAVICDRQEHPKTGSYTTRLFEQGEDEIVKKVGEEAIEVILAAKSQGNARLIEEIADLTYHVLLLMAERGLTPVDVEDELARRHR
jgi:phosphoribosyl-ATP pyrophosphohydrolase/phosphoribosyl-AMP cyclohydrolase